MKEKPSVIIIDNSRNTTGAFNAIFYYAQYAQTDYSFTFILPKNSRAGIRAKEAGFCVEYLPFIEISKSLKNILLYFPFLLFNTLRLLNLVKKHSAKIVHVNDFYNMVGATGKLLGGKYKLLTHVRFMPDRFPTILVRFWTGTAFKFSERVICVSNAVKKHLPEHVKIKVIYDTIPAIENPKEINKEHCTPSLTTLLYLAHYIPGKGHNFALKAFHQAYQHNNQLRLKFVGGDLGLKKNKDYKDKLKKKAVELKLDIAITFEEASNNIEIELEQCDIMLNFSESESFSFTCLEALAHGIPLIATDCGGPAELFEHGKSGFLVPNKDVNAMTKAILKLANESELRVNFSWNSKEYVKNKFAVENTCYKLNRLYQDVLIAI